MNQVTKEEFRSWSASEKWIYFKDYYLKITLVILVFFLIVIYILYTAFFNRSNSILSVATIEDTCSIDANTLSNDLYSFYNITSDRDNIICDSYDLDDINSNTKFVTYMTAHNIDIIITDTAHFNAEYKQGAYMNLHDILPEDIYQCIKDDFYVTDYGIDISNTDKYRTLSDNDTHLILGIADTTLRTDACITFFEFLLAKNP